MLKSVIDLLLSAIGSHLKKKIRAISLQISNLLRQESPKISGEYKFFSETQSIRLSLITLPPLELNF